MSKPRKRYSKEFKDEAVKLAERVGFSKAGIELGVSSQSIRKWSEPSLKGGMANSGQESLEAEIKRLRKENGYLKKINEVLKKSTAIFSSDHIGGSK